MSFGRVFMEDTRGQRKLLRIWIILVIVKKHLVQIVRIQRPNECESNMLAGIRSTRPGRPTPNPTPCRANLASEVGIN